MDFNRLTGPQRKIMRECLKVVFPRRQSLDVFLQENQYDALADLVPQSNYDTELFEFIREFMRLGLLTRFLGDVRGTFPESPGVADLDGRMGLVDANAERAPAVEKSGGLERLVRNSGFADLYLWLGLMKAMADRVCHISFPAGVNLSSGTGFLVGPDLVLTNRHVVAPLIDEPARAADAAVTLGYRAATTGREPGSAHALAPAWHLADAPHSAADVARDRGEPQPGELDYALLRLASRPGEDTLAVGSRGWVDLAATTCEPVPEPGAIVYVLQHPDGLPLKQAPGVVTPTTTPLRLRYDADTLPGSSGSLVLNSRLEPVALHHAGEPTSHLASYNQGIPLNRIAEHIRSAGIAP